MWKDIFEQTEEEEEKEKNIIIGGEWWRGEGWMLNFTQMSSFPFAIMEDFKFFFFF